jgi:hypothetical protein
MSRCKLCKETFVRISPWQKCDKIECGIEHGKIDREKKLATQAKAQARALAKQKAEKKQAEAKQKSEFKKNDRPKQLQLTRDAFNKMRRLQELKWFADRGLVATCISCGKPLGGDLWACGHFRTVGAAGHLRFDPMNTYLQHNFSCNRNKSGDVVNYKLGLIKRFGEIEGQRIIDHVETNNSKADWTCEQLIQMRKEFNAEIRRLN